MSTVNNATIFLNHSVVHNGRGVDDSMGIGDWFLSPYRYLRHGKKITITHGCLLDIKDEPEFRKKNPAKTAAAILLVAPGVIVGGSIKLLSYLRWPSQMDHHQIRIHYTPIVRLDLGSKESDLNGLKQSIFQHMAQNDNYGQTIKNLVIKTKKGTEIDELSELKDFNLEKIILVGARIIHSPSSL